MTKHYLIGVTFAVIAALFGGSSPVRGELAARRDFESVASQLDPGGELFLVLQAGRWIDRLLKTLATGEKAGLPPPAADQQAVRDDLEQIRRFLNRMGVSAWRGVGVSSTAQPGGGHVVKLFLQRDAVDSNLPFWRGLFGWQPRRLMSLDFVPAGFSMVRAGTCEPSVLWQMLVDGVRETGGQSAQVRFDAQRMALASWLGMSPDDLFASLRDELLVAVRFGKDATLTLPAGDGEWTLPLPELLAVIATGEDVLRGVVEAQLARRKIPLAESVVAGIPMRHAQTVLDGMPFPFQPALASAPGFLLLGSSPAVVEEALLAYRHRNGLVTRPAFLAAFQGLPMVNNGIAYVDPDGARILQHWRDSRFEARRSGDDSASPAGMRLAKALATGADCSLPTCALVVRNWKNGVMINGTSGVGGEALLHATGAAALAFWNSVVHGTER
jgi:hypothetical protein